MFWAQSFLKPYDDYETNFGRAQRTHHGRVVVRATASPPSRRARLASPRLACRPARPLAVGGSAHRAGLAAIANARRFAIADSFFTHWSAAQSLVSLKHEAWARCAHTARTLRLSGPHFELEACEHKTSNLVLRDDIPWLSSPFYAPALICERSAAITSQTCTHHKS
eukprot:6179239-Pleurochrysis_carterae.AAC.2